MITKINKRFHFLFTGESHRFSLPTVARESMRWGVSDRITAAIVNATLIDFGIISPEDTSSVVDRQRIRRAKMKCRNTLNTNLDKNALQGLYFDGKEIETLVVLNEEGHSENVMQEQEHTVLISEPGSKFLSHITTSDKKAITICNGITEYLNTINALPEIKVLGADSTSTNT